MELSDFLTPDRVILDVRSRDKAQLINEIARQFARLVRGVKPEAVEAAFLAREQLGSTGLGMGFALPHARIEGLQSYLGLFMRLAKPVEFDAIDGKPVTMVFALLIPAEAASHVAALAAISRKFRAAGLVLNLAKAKTPSAVYDFLTDN